MHTKSYTLRLCSFHALMHTHTLTRAFVDVHASKRAYLVATVLANFVGCSDGSTKSIEMWERRERSTTWSGPFAIALSSVFFLCCLFWMILFPNTDHRAALRLVPFFLTIYARAFAGQTTPLCVVSWSRGSVPSFCMPVLTVRVRMTGRLLSFTTWAHTAPLATTAETLLCLLY